MARANRAKYGGMEKGMSLRTVNASWVMALKGEGRVRVGQSEGKDWVRISARGG